MRHQLAVGVGAAAADVRELFVGQAQVTTVREIIHQRTSSSILLGVRQLLDLFQRIAKQFGQ